MGRLSNQRIHADRLRVVVLRKSGAPVWLTSQRRGSGMERKKRRGEIESAGACGTKQFAWKDPTALSAFESSLVRVDPSGA